MKAIIYKTTGNWYTAKAIDGVCYMARIKGVFRIDKIHSSNPIAVGDEVNIEMENKIENTATITKIYDRKNFIIRQSSQVKKKFHILGANISQCVLVTSLIAPKTSQGFVDRFLITCAAYQIPAIILLNKADLYTEQERKWVSFYQNTYAKMGYAVYPCSCLSDTCSSIIHTIFHQPISMLCGHSGSGKSSLINRLIPSLQIKTQAISDWSQKGIHTTTTAEMYDINQQYAIIDTPGIKEWGLVDINKEELAHYFLDMKPFIGKCKFTNCLHVQEPQCAILQAVKKNAIHPYRYQSYINILHSIPNKQY